MSASVLPARAGMSPVRAATRLTTVSAPRTGGDEPSTEMSPLVRTQCSPHGRG